MGLVISAPLFALAAVLIKLDSPGPVLFRQQRIGQHGRPFTLYKFRTMVQNAPSRVPSKVEDFSSYVFQPPGRDSRVTPIGRILRRTSLDELPQLLNIVKGDMALVGPRPEIPELVAQYPPEYHRRHDVKPGLTGLAQVMGRSDLTYDEIMGYDLKYISCQSFRQDIEILFRTVIMVLRQEGAR